MATSGYLLVIGHSINAEIMSRYNSVLPPIYKKFGGFYLGLGAPGQGVEHLEGEWFDRSLMLAQFKKPNDVSNFWYSPEYEEAKKLRKGGGEFNVFQMAGNEHEAPVGEPAFLISFYRVFDADAYAPFAKAEEKTLSHHDVNYLSKTSSDQAERLEGDLVDHNLNIIAFPTIDSATSLWEGIEHKEIREKRSKAASFNTYLVRGLHR